MIDIELFKTVELGTVILFLNQAGIWNEGELISFNMVKEDIADAKIRLNKEYPEVSELLDVPFMLVRYAPKGGGGGELIRVYDARLKNPPVVNPPVNLVSKSQMLGLLTQLENLILSTNNTAKALRSVADLYGKPDEVKAELLAIRELVSKS